MDDQPQQPEAPAPVDLTGPHDDIVVAAHKLSKVEAARAKSLSHNITQCLCPFCRQRRVKEGVPHPPSKPRQPKPAKVNSKAEVHSNAPATPDVLHDKDKCPCAECAGWRSDRARTAAQARYTKQAESQYDWDKADLRDAEQHLGEMRREIERGARILQQRFSTANQQFVKCEVCKKDILNGRWAQSKTIRDKETNLLRNIYLCSAACIANQSYNPANHGPVSGEPTGLHPEQGAARK